MRENRTKSRALLGVAIGLCLTSVATASEPPIAVDPSVTEPALLRYQFAAGETVTYRTEIDQRLTMSGPALAEPAETSMRMVMDAVHSVTAVDEGGAGTFDQRVTGATVNVTVSGQSIPAEDLARQLNGLAMSVQMTPRGEVLNVSIGETPDPQTAQMMALIEESMRRTTIEFPEEAVTIGESWTRSVPLDLSQPGMELDTSVNATYTLLGYAEIEARRCAVLQTDVSLTVAGTFADMGLTSTADGSGQGSGYTYFDIEAGTLARSSMDMSLDTTIIAEGIELTQAVVMTMNITKL